MFAGDAEADGGAVVLHVEGEAVEAELGEQVVGEVGQGVEGVGELVDRRRVGLAEAEVVGGDEVVVVGQVGEQLAEHERAGREAVQQHQGRRLGVAGLSVEEPAALDVERAVAGGEGGHRVVLASRENQRSPLARVE